MVSDVEFSEIINSFDAPVLIVSTIAGRGIYSIGEAIKERIPGDKVVYHIPIEEVLPGNALHEDYERYGYISNNCPVLLNLVYRIPFFYYRKLIREKYLKVTDLSEIKKLIESRGIRTVICASHRPAFWLSCLKLRYRMDFRIWGMLSEFGRNLGWKYIFWEAMDGYFSPVERGTLDFSFPKRLDYVMAEPPCKKEYRQLAGLKGDKDKALFVTGHWGQIFSKTAKALLEELLVKSPALEIFVVCGKNEKLHSFLSGQFKGNSRVHIYGELDSLASIMQRCASIITKPGISTILEAHAAGRKIFLIKGMPVAEDNNARYAVAHYGAEYFHPVNFKKWHDF